MKYEIVSKSSNGRSVGWTNGLKMDVVEISELLRKLKKARMNMKSGSAGSVNGMIASAKGRNAFS